MKRLSIILMFLASIISALSQNPNKVYSIDKEVPNKDLPQKRTLYGGTIINVKYIGSGFSKTVQGAFEYACKLIEEKMPTTYPLNITVEFSNALRNDELALVENFSTDSNMCWIDGPVDKVYAKRFAQIWNGPYLGTDSVVGVDFFRDTNDFSIKFSKSKSFDYNIDPTNLNANKYDFITVALQALIKGMGFTCKAYVADNKMHISEPANKFTYTILGKDPIQNYNKAISGNAYFENYYGGEHWLLECGQPYKQGISLNYLSKSNSKECSIMHFGIAKGKYIRDLGDFLPDFFSYCGWDMPIVVSIDHNLTISTSNTNDVIGFQGTGSQNPNKYNVVNDSNTDDVWSYIEDKNEVMDDGDYVLLKDGSWKRYTSLCNLTENNLYARTVDGYLRLKNVREIKGVGNYSNWDIKYQMYDYLPQVPEASLNAVLAPSTYSFAKSKRNLMQKQSEDEFVDAEIGFKNIEGTTSIVVEQTDSDYPVPFNYVVDDIYSGKFLALMNKKYPSTYTLTYINANGETTGETFTIDLRNNIILPNDFKANIAIYNNNLEYYLENIEKCNLYCKITNLQNGNTVMEEKITNDKGSIELKDIPSGCYVIAIYNNNIKIKELKWNKK